MYLARQLLSLPARLGGKLNYICKIRSFYLLEIIAVNLHLLMVIFMMVSVNVIVQRFLGHHGPATYMTYVLEGAREMYVLHMVYNIVLLGASLAAK